ncbi:hypothetical protein Tco_0739990 [Tanacetum coccineum]
MISECTLKCEVNVYRVLFSDNESRVLKCFNFETEAQLSRQRLSNSLQLKNNAPGYISAATHFGGVTDWYLEPSGNGNDDGDGSHDLGSGGRRTSHTTRRCTYKEFLNCQPLNFKRTEGAVGLAYWFEKMESMFYINNCIVECQVKYVTYTFLGGALTWWNSHVRTVGHDAAYEMPWKTLMKKMTEAYCPRSEIKKLEIELWNLKVKGTNVKYTGVLPGYIQGNVMSARPKTLQEEIELANDLMDQKVRAYADRQADNKRRMDNIP